jgi:enoyl-CoA hydratase/carnithine racemase
MSDTIDTSDPSDPGRAPLVRVERHGPAAVLTLDRPDALNAFTLEMVSELRRAVLAAVADPEVIGVVITGAGRGFCAGLDASALAATTAAANTGGAGSGSGTRDVPADGELAGLFSFLVEQPKPIIAAVNGVAAGGGFVLAAKCDLRFAAEEASFITIFSKRGLIAEHGLTWLLPRQIGVGAALDLLWSSRKVGAEEAMRLGLVQRVVPGDQVVTEAVTYLQDLAEQVSPASMADTKRLIYGQLGADMADAFTEADEATWLGVQRSDATEGARAYIERRPPRFDPIGEAT